MDNDALAMLCILAFVFVIVVGVLFMVLLYTTPGSRR